MQQTCCSWDFLNLQRTKTAIPADTSNRTPTKIVASNSSSNSVLYLKYEIVEKKLQMTCKYSKAFKVNILFIKLKGCLVIYIRLTLQERGAFKAPPEQNQQFKHLLVIQLSRKNLTFPRTLWGCLSYPFGGSKQPKKGFLQHFCRWW